MPNRQKTPFKNYHNDLQRRGFVHDTAQENAVNHLQRLFDEYVAWQTHRRLSPLKRWLTATPKKPQGLYFWGGVGRGKTYLVDNFYDCLPFENKWRMHFHRFMQRIHNELKSLQNQSDPLEIIAKRIAAETSIICFDEFFVQDITDAMLLGKLFEYLFAFDVVLVATSNIVPDELYRNGLQRERFIPAIKLINANCEVVNVDSGTDYRLRTLTKADIFLTEVNEQTDQALFDYFFELAPDHRSHCREGTIEIAGRKIPVRCESDDVVFFDFSAICESFRSTSDYMELARLYHAVIIRGVKPMGQGNDDTARRFIALVDEFYERRVKLVMSSQVKLQEIYQGGRLSFEFQRCLSRLQEMQSREYLALEHLA
ncbi:cell division protein ZapE [Idiomarina tyrosinivorans]|uniref:Cell division protein ZapE n=1 Tax=Idiomarina tyrosinivorans TaxID=1445662 RepID=A0A432ZQE5_9GAMM|nr:cell division protein ZapE [Idiomarina tyrosinivorans]RUO80103.1 cell division protein ZapE [Idiomarina tyrosinivorans]